MDEATMTDGERDRGQAGETVGDRVVMGDKPLHRFIRGEPRSLGIVIMMFGFGEIIMGIQMKGEDTITSSDIYIPFWLGALFLVCGNLSIYTDVHPSKKMVTVSLAMYIVSLLGVAVSIGYRSFVINHCIYSHSWYAGQWRGYRYLQLMSVEAILLAFSLFVSGVLIFLSTMARFALKSSNTQIIIQQRVLPASPE